MKWKPFLCLLACGWLGTSPARAYDANVWLDACEFQDSGFEHLIEAEAMLVPKSQIVANGNGTYKIITAPFTSYYEPLQQAVYQLDPSSLFYAQPRVAAGRSGVLVGQDAVLTAPHTANFDFFNFRVVFGLHSKLVNGVCVQPDWNAVPAEDVYEPVEMLANTYEETDYPELPYDFAFLRLDRDTDRQPLRIRRSGQARVGDRLLSVGHPKQLSAKVSPEGEALGWNPVQGLLMNGLHHLAGSSGSMIYNSDADYVETVVSQGICGGMPLIGENLVLLTPLCGTTPRAANRPLAEVADESLPGFSLIASPLNEVVHRALVNGVPSNAVTAYQLRAPEEASGPIHWQVLNPPVQPGKPKLTLNLAQNSGNLAPGQSLNFQATATAATQCGVYERTLQVSDLTHGYTDYIFHRFEVGMRQFTVTPDDGFSVEKMNPPYDQYDSKTYTLSNPSPTPVKVLVEGPNWVQLKVKKGQIVTVHLNKATIELSGSNSKTSSAQVEVSIDGTIAEGMMPHQEYTGELNFSIDFSPGYPSCYIPSNTSRPLSFIKGKQSFELFTEGEFIPQDSYVSELEVPVPFTIDWLSLDVGVWGVQPPFYHYLDDLQITLVSPQGEELPLWDLNELPSDSYYSDEITTHFGYDLPITVLHLDDALTPSPLGTELNSLQDQQALGVWKLKISSPGSGAFLVNWRLHFYGTPLDLEPIVPPDEPIPLPPQPPPIYL